MDNSRIHHVLLWAISFEEVGYHCSQQVLLKCCNFWRSTVLFLLVLTSIQTDWLCYLLSVCFSCLPQILCRLNSPGYHSSLYIKVSLLFLFSLKLHRCSHVMTMLFSAYANTTTSTQMIFAILPICCNAVAENYEGRS